MTVSIPYPRNFNNKHVYGTDFKKIPSGDVNTLPESNQNNASTPHELETNPYLSSLPILAVVYRFVYLPTANLPIYHNLPISTDFFADLPNFNFFYRSFCYFM